MNISIIKNPPPGNFEEVSIYASDWQSRFLDLAKQRKPVKYELHTMPVIPLIVEDELSKGTYRTLVLAADTWQRFLVPIPRRLVI
jgi:hypothetical protein